MNKQLKINKNFLKTMFDCFNKDCVFEMKEKLNKSIAYNHCWKICCIEKCPKMLNVQVLNSKTLKGDTNA